MSRKYLILVMIILLFGGFIKVNPCSSQDAGNPYYFIAIHNEPEEISIIAEKFLVLREMVRKATEYNIKLTLMFSVPWANFINKTPERKQLLELWRQNGHEIAAHHHSIYHFSWDGYTNYSADEARWRAREYACLYDFRFFINYRGTIEDFMRGLAQINPTVKSGCFNDEVDKQIMPAEIIYDTCSGFTNFGVPGARLGDSIPEKGVNKFIATGIINSIERRWLSHYLIGKDPNHLVAVSEIFNTLNNSSVYGVIIHSNSDQLSQYLNFIDFLHSKDLGGIKSKTVTEIIEQNLLPEQAIPQELVDTIYPNCK